MKVFQRLVLWVLVPLLTLAAAVIGVAGVVRGCEGTVVRDTVVTVVRDTVVTVVRDTVPMERERRVLCYVPVVRDVGADSTLQATKAVDSVAVVQKTYSDDSTYTAWVSGVEYGCWPKLDSVTVRQREIVKTVHETVTLVERKKSSRFSVGVVGGYGYGVSYKGFEPYVGIGVTYRLFPP